MNITKLNYKKMKRLTKLKKVNKTRFKVISILLNFQIESVSERRERESIESNCKERIEKNCN